MCLIIRNVVGVFFSATEPVAPAVPAVKEVPSTTPEPKPKPKPEATPRLRFNTFTLLKIISEQAEMHIKWM